jgi:hypothetical protein
MERVSVYRCPSMQLANGDAVDGQAYASTLSLKPMTNRPAELMIQHHDPVGVVWLREAGAGVFRFALRHFTGRMTVAEAEQYLSTVFRPLLAVDSSQALYGEGSSPERRYRLPWFDSLIGAATIQGQCSTPYSEDLQSGQRFGDVRVENPFLGTPDRFAPILSSRRVQPRSELASSAL